MNEERLAQIALHFIPGIGHMMAKQLISYCGSAQAVIECTKSKLQKIPGIGTVTADSIIKNASLKKAEEEFIKSEKVGARIVLYTDAEFPKRLKHINDAPSLLYVKGNTDLNSNKIVSIVGTRKATNYGKEITSKIIDDLLPHKPLIVSGLAYGIDIQAHKSALKAGLDTLGVMASGINIIYPSVHKSTAQSMINQGALITENLIDSKPDAPKFPARNRIIAGMADVIIVIEAAARGGALITAEIANGYNKDVFAVPGKVTDEYSMGCNALIKSNKAHLLHSVKDIEYIMNWEKGAESTNILTFDMSVFDDDEKKVIHELREFGDYMPLDNLSWKTQVSASKLASILLNLEFKGFVTSIPGKRFGIKSK